MIYLSLDIETECAVDGCQDGDCRHALDHHRNRITCVGLYGSNEYGLIKEVYRDLSKLYSRLSSLAPFTLVGYNIISFDLKTLKAHGLDLTQHPVEDVQLMAVAHTEKVSNQYLEWYEARRKEINKTLPAHHKAHREAKQHSLKTVAPFFLGVEPFWENTENKDNDEYVLTDAKHTFDLFTILVPRLKEEGTYNFYKEKLIPWAWMLFQGEWEGVCLDENVIAEKEQEAKRLALESKIRLDEYWKEAYETYRTLEEENLRRKHEEKLGAAIHRLKFPTLKDQAKATSRYEEKVQRTRDRYEASLKDKIARIEPFNLDSPAQLTWLLRDYLGYDITNYEGEESTGIEVLERLAAEGKEDVKELIQYREQTKLCTAFFPSYREYAYQGRIHCNFNMSTARTGRTASNSPNLQQQPGHVKKIFIAPYGQSFITRDESGIEPVVIAYFSQDPILCDLLIRGGNFHSANTPSFFPYVDCSEDDVKKLFPVERDAAKELGLLLIYGGGWKRVKISLMKRGFKLSDKECKLRYENFRERYHHTFAFKEEVLDPRLRSGETITNLFGRKFKLEPDDVHMKGLNRLVQSSASDLLLQSSYKISKEFKEKGIGGLPLLWVHDEVVVQVENKRLKEAEEIVERCMTNYKLPTPYGLLPLKVEGKTAPYWAK